MEIVSTVDGAHPSWSAPIGARNLTLDRSGVWQSWDTGVAAAPSETPPYSLCDETLYSVWHVVSAGDPC